MVETVISSILIKLSGIAGGQPEIVGIDIKTV